MISGKLYNNMIRQQFYTKLYITSTQLLSLFTTPVTLVAAQANIFYIPRSVHIFREAGIAYTLNGSAAIGLYTAAVTAPIGTVPTSGFMDGVGPSTSFASAPNATTTPAGSFTATQIATATNAALVITNSVANLTVGTGGIFVTCLYEQWPTILGFN